MHSQSNESQKSFNDQIIFQSSILAMTKQVAHDIRSPVTALNALVANLPEVSEEKRQFIKEISERINSIANDLLEKTRNINQPQTEVNDSEALVNLEAVNPESVIRRVVEEKKLEYGARKDVRFVHKANFQELLCQINEVELSRVLSNLINNSVEALKGQGEVSVQSQIIGDNFEIIIKDNGQGIPSDVLEKLGREPVSYGKQGRQSGSGIGVFHACNSIKKMGGQLLIESRLGQGTAIRILFPVMKKAA